MGFAWSADPPPGVQGARGPKCASAEKQMTRRLTQVIVGPAGEAAHAIGVTAPAAQDDHRQVGVDTRREPVGGPDPVEQTEPVAVLEQEVEHYQRGLAHLDRPQALPRPARAGDPKAVGGQVVEQEGTRGVVVLDDEHQASFGRVHAG